MGNLIDLIHMNHDTDIFMITILPIKATLIIGKVLAIKEVTIGLLTYCFRLEKEVSSQTSLARNCPKPANT